ncbi:MAG TPA: hypothetical protein VFS10_01490 [Pyrinomonadaceae bacterium]|nr:hypothetical protein [Pyrinomonadaceae bacterium]
MRTKHRLLTSPAFIIFLALLTLGPLSGMSAAFVNHGGGAGTSPHFLLARQQPQTGARPFDEFGDIQISDWLARVDNLAVELQSRPTTKGYIVAYGVPNKFPGWPSRRANQVRGYLIKARGLDPARVEVVYGGYRDEVMYQLWVVEPGAQLPVPPFDFAAALAREKTPFLFDRFRWFPLSGEGSDIEDNYIGYLDERGRYEAFVLALRSDPSLRGCVIFYATRRARRGTDRRLAARVKRDIITNHSIGAERIVARAGGYRHPNQTVELWLVPPGSALPKPTRYVAPPKRRAGS